MRFLNDLTLQELFSRGIAWLVFVAVAGWAVALAASARGALRHGQRDRLTLDPFAHVALGGLAMALLFRQGWIRPLPGPLGRGAAALAFAAALTVPLLLIFLMDLLRPLIAGLGSGAVVGFGLMVAKALQVLAAGSWALNLLPVRPLAGGYLVEAVAPRLGARLCRAENVIAALLIFAIIAGWLPEMGGTLLPHLSWLSP